MISKSIYSLPFLAFLFCCGQSSPGCSRYGNEALGKLQEYYSSEKDTTHLLTALELSNKAIDCNPSNLVAYNVKLVALNFLGRYRESLTVLDKMYLLSGQADIRMFAEKGLVYEEMGLADSARQIYDAALSECDRRLSSKPADSVQLIFDKFYVVALYHGKDQALTEFDNYFHSSNSTTLSSFRAYLLVLDKNRILFPR